MNYNEELNKLFEKWELVSEKAGFYGFCRDGLMQKGEIFNVTGTDDKVYWGRNSGNENETWDRSKKKIAFLMKDTNANPNEDSREWIGRQNRDLITHKFFKSISLWLLGLSSFKQDGDYLPFKDANVGKKYTQAFDEVPLAIVNCKKESGVGKIDNSELWQHAYNFKDYLRKQFEILAPNIIICGGGSGTVLRIAKEIIYPDLVFKKTNDWIYYNKEKDIVLIDSYHPSAMIPYENTYNGMMEGYKELIIKNER